MDVHERARIHAALGDPYRLRIADTHQLSDRTFMGIASIVGLPGNAVAHHLHVLEVAGLIERRVSEGDHRRRYVGLRHDRLADLAVAPSISPKVVLFVCTHNSARSQFAEALWRRRTGRVAESAGNDPALRVHPKAVRAALEHGLDLSAATPKDYAAVPLKPDLVVSVCDRARDAGLPFEAPSLHWSIPDPVASGKRSAFRSAFRELADRIDRLAAALPN
jgi:protein-tyrosine-phosphatase